MIDREELVRRHNPKLSAADPASPMTLGNGGFAFTADITGLQTLYDEYAGACPLLTMADWGWHSAPFRGRMPAGRERMTGRKGAQDELYPSLSQLPMTEYSYKGRVLSYPVAENEDNSDLYNWLRQNPHRMNLMRLRLVMTGEDGDRPGPVSENDISDCSQELDMYTGILTSRFRLRGRRVTVETAVGTTDTVAVHIESQQLKAGLAIALEVPYGSHEKCGGVFDTDDACDGREHSLTACGATDVPHSSEGTVHPSGRNGCVSAGIWKHRCDRDEYYLLLTTSGELHGDEQSHRILIGTGDPASQTLAFTVSLGQRPEGLRPVSFREVRDASRLRWYTFWHTGAMIETSHRELERRIVTSMYLLGAQDTGSLPPQETGLTCNSWYGKFHLEMHPLHQAWLPLFGRGGLMERSLGGYIAHLDDARAEAARNGFKGARWPKMIGPGWTDSPSVIAPLLLWQQPHILLMLELLYKSRYSDSRAEVPREPAEEFLRRYNDVVRDTAVYMADRADCGDGACGSVCHLNAPVIPAQENHAPLTCFDPAFELMYWSFGLRLAYAWLERSGELHPEWLDTADRMAPLHVDDEGLIEAHGGCDTTFTEHASDHPSMLFGYALTGDTAATDKPGTDFDTAVRSTFSRVCSSWDKESLWGWDFALLAMTAHRLGMKGLGFALLLMDTPKNTYVMSGNNAQGTRDDLPLYLPGNGSLLLAMTMLDSGPGIDVSTEGIMRWPW